MRAKHATIDALANTAGVSKSTIESARKGHQIHDGLAAAIVTALETHTFTYTPAGRKKAKGMIHIPTNPLAGTAEIKTTYMNNFDFKDDHELIHTVGTGRPNKYLMPVHKTEEEVDRMWAYSKMMGHRK
jgi:hypothetical protein